MRVTSVDSNIEQGADAGRIQHRVAIAARSHQSRRDPGGAQSLKQGDRAGEGHGAHVGQPLLEELLLASRQTAHGAILRRIVDLAFGHLDLAGGEEGADPILSGASVDVASVVVLDVEAPCLRPGQVREHFVEQLLPRPGVHRSRVGDHTVHVEDDRVVVPQTQTRAARRSCGCHQGSSWTAGYRARMSRSWAANPSDSSWSRCQMLRP